MVIFKMCDLIICCFVYFRPFSGALSTRRNYCIWREIKSV